MSKLIKYDEQARKSIQAGIDKVTDCVCGTLGPKGLNAVLGKGYGSPLITNDGVSIIKEVEVEDPFENMGVELIKEVATKTNDDGGDGTTTSAILAREILKEGLKHITSGANGVFLKRGIDRAVKDVVEELKSLAIPVADDLEKVKQIATISANNEFVGDLIADAMKQVGTDGVITLEDSKSNTTYIDVVEGMQFDKGYVSPYLATDMIKGETVMEKPYIVIINQALNTTNLKEFSKILEKSVLTQKPMLIIADDYSPEVIETLVINKLKGVLQVVAVKAPGYGDNKKDQLNDMAVFTGAEVITQETGNKIGDANVEMFGTAKKIIVTKDNTTIISGDGDEESINVRYEQLKETADKSTSDYDRTKLEERMAKLKGRIALLYVAGNTETEQKELKLRVEDALNATKAAVAEGIVAGGGSALAYVAKKLFNSSALEVDRDNDLGYNIVISSLTKPLWYIAKNAGLNSELVVTNVCTNDNKNYGINANTGEYTDMIAEGIVDPVKVTRVALQNAASVAGMILTTNVAVVDKPEKDNNTAPASGCSGCGGY